MSPQRRSTRRAKTDPFAVHFSGQLREGARESADFTQAWADSFHPPMLRTAGRSLSTFLLAALPLTACESRSSGGDERSGQAAGGSGAASSSSPAPGPSPEPAPAPEGTGGTEPVPDKARSAELERPSKEEAEAGRKELAKLLGEGRKASKAGDHSTAIERFRAALKLNPAHAGVLGELGWAHFKAGELDPAEDVLLRALRHSRTDEGRGMVLYNLGRVHEAREDFESAATYYARSLERRPNDTVKARLEGLEAKVGAASVHPEKDCAFAAQNGDPPRDLCHGIVTALAADLEGEAGEDADLAGDILCMHNPTRELDERDVGPDYAVAAGEHDRVTDYMLEIDGDTRATIFSYNDIELGLFTEQVVLAVVTKQGWYLYPIAMVEHPGVSYADEEAHGYALRAEQVVPGGAKELVVEWSHGGHDGDLEGNMMWSYDTRQVALVSLEGGKPAWLATLRTQREEAYDIFLEDLPKPDDPLVGTESKGRVKVDWTGTPGKLVVSLASGDAPTPTGTYAVADYPVQCPAELAWGGAGGSVLP